MISLIIILFVFLLMLIFFQPVDDKKGDNYLLYLRLYKKKVDSEPEPGEKKD